RIGGMATGSVARARKAVSTQSTASRSSGTSFRNSASVRMVMRGMAGPPVAVLHVAPLCPAGHLPHKGGGQQAAWLSPIGDVAEGAKTVTLPISPLVGEMSGRTEGSAKEFDLSRRVLLRNTPGPAHHVARLGHADVAAGKDRNRRSTGLHLARKQCRDADCSCALDHLALLLVGMAHARGDLVFRQQHHLVE